MNEINNKKNENSQELSSVPDEKKQINSSGAEIELFENLLSSEELVNAGYKKVSDNLIYQMEPFLQQIPGHIANQATKKFAEKSFNEAVKDTFRCTLDPGMHLAHRKGQPDAFLGTGLDNVSNKISGQASWTKNDAILTIPATPEIISGVFNVMSIVTSQYYLSEINNKLDNIDKRLNSLEQKFDDKDISKLKSFYKTLKDIQNRYNFIKADKDRKVAYNQQIINIKSETDSLLEFFIKQIDNIKNSATNNDDEKNVIEKIYKINYYQKCSLFAQYIILFANSIEIGINDIADEAELFSISNNLRNSMRNKTKSWENTYIWEKKYITSAKAFKLKKTDYLLSGAAGLLGGVADFVNPLSFNTTSDNLGVKAASLVTEFQNDKNAIKKKNLFDYCQKNNEAISELCEGNLKIVDGIDEYRNQINAKTELVYIDGKWYFKRLIEKNPNDE